MGTTSAYQFQTITRGDVLPEDAVDLFGDDVREAFEGAGAEASATPMVIAATDQGEWLAGVYLWMEGDDGERVASIRQLVVKPAYRGRGIAGWLLRRAHAAAQEMGCTRIRSTAGWGCPDHLNMYQRLGYERVGDERPYLVSKAL